MSKKWIVRGVVAAAAVAVVAGAFFVFGGTTKEEVAECPGSFTNEQGGLFVGSCDVYDENGKPIDLADYKGKYLFLNFWASWCPFCRIEMPDMEEVWQEHKGDGNFAMIAVSIPEFGGRTESEEASKDFFFVQHSFTYQFAYDKNGGAVAVYEMPGLPTTYLVNPDGQVSAIMPGGRHWASATCQKLLATWIAGQEITRGVFNGCR